MTNVTALIHMGNDAFQREDFPRALSYYQQAMEGVRGDPDHLADLYGNLGNVYGAIGQVAQARDYYDQAVEILKAREDYVRLGTTFANIGNLYVDGGASQEAIHFYKQAVLLLGREEPSEALALLYSNFSLALLQGSGSADALLYAEKGVRLAQGFPTPRLRAATLHRLAKAEGARGKTGDAKGHSEAAYTLYAQVGDEMGMAAALYHQAALYEEMGDLLGAVRCMEQVVSMDEKYALPKRDENRKRLTALYARLAPRTP